MKKILLCVLLIFFTKINAQNNEILVQNLNGTSFDLNKLIGGEKNQPVIFFTWAKSWCWPCVKALDEFNKNFTELQNKHNLKIVALNLDSKYSRQEIKEFAQERGWNFDVYVDTNKNYITATNTTNAPITFLIFNGKIIKKLNGFTDGIAKPESTANFFIEITTGLFSNVIYFDKDWKNTTKKFATYVRYKDKIGDKYEVTDRWITGEIQMRGSYTDLHCTIRTGEFKWYNKDGTISSSETF